MNLDRRYLQVEDSFIAEDLQQMKFAENYNSWLFSLLQPYLGKRILEIGPGIGNLTKHFILNAEYVEGIEPNTACAELLMKACSEYPTFTLQIKRIEDSDIESLITKHFDTIVCVNVLEHIKNDVEVLVQFKNIVTINGNLVLLVPAIPWAYGPIDAAIGHFRRYSHNHLQKIIMGSGLQLVHIQYSNFLGLIGWTFNTRIVKNTKQSDFQIKLFDNLVPVLSRLEKMIHPPIGLSLLAVGVKINDA